MSRPQRLPSRGLALLSALLMCGWVLSPTVIGAQAPPGAAWTAMDLPTAVSSWSSSAGSSPLLSHFGSTVSVASAPTPTVLFGEIQEGSQEGSGWKKGLLIGGGIGLALGLIAHALIDSLPCDSCSGTGTHSFGGGARLEFAVGFGLLGASLGALIGR